MVFEWQTLISDNREDRKSKKLIVIALIILFSLDAWLSKYYNADTLTLGIWIFLCFALFLKHIKFFIKYIVYIYSFSTNVLAVYIIENNYIYLYELGTYSARYNSLFLITLTHCFFIIILLLSDSKIEKRVNRHIKFAKLQFGKKNIDNSIMVALSVIFMVASAYMLSKAIVNPASKNHMDRFIYQETFITGMWRIIHTYLVYLIPVLVILSYKRKSVLTLCALFLFCLYMYLVGHKFGIFLTVMAFFIPYIIERFKLDRISFKNINKIFAIGIIVIIGLLIILYTFTNKTYGTDKQGFIQYLYERLAQQGQMWWAVFGKEQGAGFHFDELSVSIKTFFGIDKQVIENYDFGIYKLMKLVTPYSIYQAKMASFSRYAFSTQATLYYYFKSIGLISISGIMALFLSFITNWYWQEVKHSSWFGSIVSGFFYTLILSVYLQSDFNILFSKRKFLLAFAFIFIRAVFLILGNKQRKREELMQYRA